MPDHECIRCNQYTTDLRQCPLCEEDVCEVCRPGHNMAHYHGPQIVEAIEAGDDARVRRLIHAVNGTTPELVPFVRYPIPE